MQAMEYDNSPDDFYSYQEIPWYRRAWVNNVFVLLGLFGCLPTAYATCMILMTGEVYENGYDNEGQPKVWGPINRLGAVQFSVGWTIGYGCAIYEALKVNGLVR
jgi:hypothetical protein